jgi:xanthine dehydrogenase accessory factor
MERAREYIGASRPAVVATIVRVAGSAYRRPGTKTIVAADGEGVDAGDTDSADRPGAEALARETTETGRARVESYDLSREGDVWGFGVGGAGVIDVLIEPLDAGYRPAIEAFESDRDRAICTVLESERSELAVGDRTFYDALDREFSTAWPDAVCEAVREPAAKAARTGDAYTITAEQEDGRLEVFVNGVPALPELLVLGTSHDVGPLVDLAAKSGFRVTVLGFEEPVPDGESFAGAAAMRLTSPTDLRAAHDFGANTYVAVMSHDFDDDRHAVAQLLATDVAYIGLLGPRKRFEAMCEEFDAEDRPLAPADRERVYAPIGLDLGSETPYQVAHSIVAEVLTVHNDREPTHLSAREGPIHDRSSPTGSESID